MAMDTVMKKLESKVEALLEVYRDAMTREAELQAKLAELEKKTKSDADYEKRIGELERQRDELAARLEKVLDQIDSALADND
jgi:uncharacterized protein involved in exopolysaccharide biosynthesis